MKMRYVVLPFTPELLVAWESWERLNAIAFHALFGVPWEKITEEEKKLAQQALEVAARDASRALSVVEAILCDLYDIRELNPYAFRQGNFLIWLERKSSR